MDDPKEPPVSGQAPPEIRGVSGRPPSRGERLFHLVFLGAATAVVLAASFLTPDPSGTGTHTQLGFPPCGLYARYGVPCLSCGMTTSFAHMARLQVLRALWANPLGALLFLGVVAFGLLNAWAAVSGWSLFDFVARRDLTRWGLLLLGLALASWAFKIWAVCVYARQSAL